MGKTYLDVTKYMIYATAHINGRVEKPDIIGAIFGQTEGLIGEELDLRNLQKNGRIGRIEVETEVTAPNKVIAKIRIPTSLDMVETSVIASALETVERVGPFESHIVVDRIEDVRESKRRKIVERAKELLMQLKNQYIPESKQIVEAVREALRKSEMIEYGEEKLPAGPGIKDSEEIIIVEGRADVINLLKHDITNVIAIGGARMGKNYKTIVELSKEKETTLFIDGDRGGEMILKELLEAGAEIDYVAKAPVGKEVEELSRKEIIKALRNKIPIKKVVFTSEKREERPEERREEKRERRRLNPMEELAKLNGTLKARFYDSDGNLIKEVYVREMIDTLKTIKNAHTLVFDGIITERLLEIAKEKGIKRIIGMRTDQFVRNTYGIEVITKYK